jgi:hypothetical protein
MRKNQPMSKNLLQEIQELAAELFNDIKLATHREEHIRVTARANKAQEILNRAQEEVQED